MDKDLDALQQGFYAEEAVYNAQLPRPSQTTAQTVDVNAQQAPQPKSRFGRQQKPQSPSDDPTNLRGRALRAQAPLLREWRSFLPAAVFLFATAAKVIGMNDRLVWIGYGGIGGVVSLALMLIGVHQERAKLGVWGFKLAIGILLMPGLVYLTFYGLTLLFSYSGFQF